MARKTNAKQEESARVASLTMTKEEFKAKLIDRIAAGEALLTYQVSTKHPNYLGDAFGSMYARNGIAYNEQQLEKFKEGWRKWDSLNRMMLTAAFGTENSSYLKEYEGHGPVLLYTTDEVRDLKGGIKRQISYFKTLIEGLDFISMAQHIKQAQHMPEAESKDVFIVHGHNEEMKMAVSNVLLKLGMNPVILHEQANGGQTIIEKFEKHGENACYAVVLLSGDDEGHAKGKPVMETRARLNVVLEMGFFIGRMGRGRVFMLMEPGVEKPGDLDGVVYTAYDGAHGTWRSALVKEMRAAGLAVSADAL